MLLLHFILSATWEGPQDWQYTFFYLDKEGKEGENVYQKNGGKAGGGTHSQGHILLPIS